MVTLWGTVVMIALPLLHDPLGLSDLQFGVWAGPSVQEVGQVVAAASPAGAAVPAIAVVVKLTRVLRLAPVIATVNAGRRLRSTGSADSVRRPPLVPLFVLVEPGELDPDEIHTPGVFVQRVVPLTPEHSADKPIEKRTAR
jgi:uncharacterized membrane protein YadS